MPILISIIEGTHDEATGMAHMLSCAWIEHVFIGAPALAPTVAVALERNPATKEPGEFIGILTLASDDTPISALGVAVKSLLPLGIKWVISTASGEFGHALQSNGEDAPVPKGRLIFGILEKPNHYRVTLAKADGTDRPEWMNVTVEHLFLPIGPFFEHPPVAEA